MYWEEKIKSLRLNILIDNRIDLFMICIMIRRIKIYSKYFLVLENHKFVAESFLRDEWFLE
jgi:hypothetical protein